jgi:DNA-binding transcriptional regulator YdaS (Cro superfamily)
MPDHSKIVAMVVAQAGGLHALGRMLGIRYQSVQSWKRIPADRVLAIELATGIPREQLRPDLYVPAPESRAKKGVKR